MILGILPAVGNGVIHWQQAGQLRRYTQHFLHYRKEFDKALLFSYRDDDPPGEFIIPVPIRHGWSARRYAFLLPFLRSKQMRACSMFRVTSLSGAIPAILAKALWRTPFVVSYGADYEAIAAIHGRTKQRWKWRWLRRLTFRFADIILCPSHVLADRLRWQFPTVPIRYHPNWVDIHRFHPARVRRAADRTVLYVGRCVKEKNLERLKHACTLAEARLMIAGTGPIWITDSQAVVPWEELPEVYHAADCFALVSLSEGGPKALGEAMASGLPCVISEAVTEGFGERVESGDVWSIAKGLRRVLEDRRYAEDLGRRGSHYARIHWDEETLMGREVAWVKDLASSRF